jgi:hypothetical protein
MRGVDAEQPRPPRRRIGAQVARDVARRQALTAQAGEHDVGEILADAAALLEHLVDLGRDRGRPGLELEVGMDPAAQVDDRLEPVAARGEARRGISARRFRPGHERARFAQPHRGEVVLGRFAANRVANRLPGDRLGLREVGPLADLDLREHAHAQQRMRAVDREMGGRRCRRRLAPPAPLVGGRLDPQLVRHHVLPGQLARRRCASCHDCDTGTRYA